METKALLRDAAGLRLRRLPDLRQARGAPDERAAPSGVGRIPERRPAGHLLVVR